MMKPKEFEPEEDPGGGKGANQIKGPCLGHTRITYVHKTNLHGRGVNETEKDSAY